MYIQEDKVNLVTRTEILKRFSKEVLETTTCQSKEIADLKAEGMESSSLRVVCFPCQLRGGGGRQPAPFLHTTRRWRHKMGIAACAYLYAV